MSHVDRQTFISSTIYQKLRAEHTLEHYCQSDPRTHQGSGRHRWRKIPVYAKRFTRMKEMMQMTLWGRGGIDWERSVNENEYRRDERLVALADVSAVCFVRGMN